MLTQYCPTCKANINAPVHANCDLCGTQLTDVPARTQRAVGDDAVRRIMRDRPGYTQVGAGITKVRDQFFVAIKTGEGEPHLLTPDDVRNFAKHMAMMADYCEALRADPEAPMPAALKELLCAS